MKRGGPHPWTKLSMAMLPFADVASARLSLPQLLRLSLFQVAVGMATVMLLGTLNRVMIVELSISAWMVALMVALPVLIAPFRALLGYRSDTHKSAVGWKRVPYLWFGTLWQMGGLAVMPFALIVLSGDQTVGPSWAGEVLAACSFLMTGLGIHMTQTAGLALASDLADEETRPRVVALLYVMFLVGMAISALVIGALLADFTKLRLIQVLQGTALATMALNLIALWKQERMRPMSAAERSVPRPSFARAWADFGEKAKIARLLFVIFVGTLAFAMQDVLLEPYGGEVLGLSVASTTLLTAIWAVGALVGFALAARWLSAGLNVYRMAARGIVAGVAAFSLVIIAGAIGSSIAFFAGAGLIGFGSGTFAIALLTAAMTVPVPGAAGRGLALGSWGAAQATAAGLGIALGGALKDLSGHASVIVDFAARPQFGYSVVYHTEILFLFITLIALGPLIRTAAHASTSPGGTGKLGLSEFPT